MDDFKLTQYRQVVKLLSSIETPGGSLGNVVQTCANNCLTLRSIMNTCDKHGISTKTLTDGIDLQELLKEEDCRAVFQSSGLSAASALEDIQAHMVQQTGHNEKIMTTPILCVHKLLMQNFDVFQAEVENEALIQEIRLETLRFENVNKKQLDITIRNTYITLAGVIITALLTMGNILVSIVSMQK